MSLRINLHAIAGALVILFASSLAFAQSEPMIQHVTVNLGTNQIKITGTNFGSTAPRLALGGQMLHLLSYSSASIEAELPDLGTGHHQLVLNAGDSPINNATSIDLPSLMRDPKESGAPSAPALAPPPSGSLVLSGWETWSYDCPKWSNCDMPQRISSGAFVVAGGCGSYYDAISVTMVNSSPSYSDNQWICTVNNYDDVNSHTIISWVQPGSYTGSSAAKVSKKPTPSILIVRPLPPASK